MESSFMFSMTGKKEDYEIIEFNISDKTNSGLLLAKPRMVMSVDSGPWIDVMGIIDFHNDYFEKMMKKFKEDK